MVRSLGKLILLFVCAVLLITLAINNLLTIQGVRNEYRDSLTMRCRYLAGSLKVGIEKVLALGIRISDIEGLDVRCQQIVSGDPEIAYCLIEGPSGDLLFTSDATLFASGSFSLLNTTGSDSSLLLSHPRLGTLYDVSIPIFAPDGTLAARARLGFPQSILSAITLRMLQHTAIVFSLASLAVFVLVGLFVRHNLVNPIRRLCDVADKIADGDFRVAVPEMSLREFKQLGQGLREMAASLRERDVKIQDGYAELELANRELQSSYEQQERTSVELSSSREMYRALLEHASDAILVVDDEDLVVLMNRAAETFLGAARNEVQGKNLFVVLSRLCGERIESEFEIFQQIRSGVLTESELSFIRPENGARIVGWLRGSVITGPDGRRMVQLTIRDITRDKQIKENLERLTVDLQNLNNMKNSFLGMASHELKTPLTVIAGYSEMILTDLADKADHSVLSMVRYISDAADRLTAIVRDMVDVTLLDRRQMLLRRQMVNVNELVRTVTREMEYFFHVRHQNLQLDLGRDLPLISCDPDRIYQVLTNLVGNAVKFTPDSGTIAVETRLVRAPLEPGAAVETGPVKRLQPPYVEIMVRDSGIGIDPHEQSHIFEKFYEVGRIEQHFTGKMAFKGRGTGLGLTIVKGIVDRHGGVIWVESVGHNPETFPGSTFHVLLPLQPEESDQ